MNPTKAALRLYNRRHAIRAENANNGRFSGAGSQFDYGQLQTPVPFFARSALEQDRAALALYQTDWQAEKLVSIPVDDMLREGWDVEGVTDEQEDQLTDLQDALGVLTAFTQAMKLEGIFGGAAIFLGVIDGQDDPSLPLDLMRVERGGLRYINVVPRNRISRTVWENNPLSPTYGRPQCYVIQGQRVHHSRLIIFDGDPLLPVPDSTVALTGTNNIRADGFGDSRLLRVMDDLTRATGSRQAAYQLVQRAGVFIAQGDFSDLASTVEGENKLANIANIVNQMNIFRGAVIDCPPGQTVPPMSVISPAFGSVPELVMSFLQVLSAASDIPATRFLGQAPGGLNSTGDGDLENYYGRLESRQRQKLRPRLMQLTRVMMASLFGPASITRELDVTFPPLWSMSETDEAAVAEKRVATVGAMLEQGTCSLEQATAAYNSWEVLPVTVTPDDPAPAAEPESTAPPVGESIAQLDAPPA